MNQGGVSISKGFPKGEATVAEVADFLVGLDPTSKVKVEAYVIGSDLKKITVVPS